MKELCCESLVQSEGRRRAAAVRRNIDEIVAWLFVGAGVCFVFERVCYIAIRL